MYVLKIIKMRISMFVTFDRKVHPNVPNQAKLSSY